jgi:hypothetical protein
MGGKNSLPSERCAIVGNIDPDAYANGAQSTGYIPLKDFGRFMAIVQAGDIVSTGTVDAKITAYTSDAGAGAYDVPGAAITQLTQAGSDSNKQAVINFDVDSLAGSTKYTHFRLTVTMGTAGADLGAIVLGFDPRHAPASDGDAATVDSIASG